MSLEKIQFDPTDSDTLAASNNIGAYVRAGTDGDRISSTNVGGKEGLDVNVISAIQVDLDGVYDVGTNPTPDSVGVIAHVRDASPDETNQTFRSTGGAASSDDVVAANVFGLDVNAFGMVFDGTTWDRLRGTAGAVNINDGGNSITVDATDLDIRDLTHVSDSVKVGDGTDFLAINADGSINITDNGGSITVDGSVTVNDAALANTSIVTGRKQVSTGASSAITSPTANRKYFGYQNLAVLPVYIGPSGINESSSFGWRIAGGVSDMWRMGAGISPHVYAPVGTNLDTRFMELV